MYAGKEVYGSFSLDQEASSDGNQRFLFIVLCRNALQINKIQYWNSASHSLTECILHTGGPRLVRFLGFGKNRTMRISY